MNFSIKDFFSKCDQIRRKLQIWLHLLKKSLMENFIFCAVGDVINETKYWRTDPAKFLQDSLQKIRRDMAWLRSAALLKKRLGPFLITLSQIKLKIFFQNVKNKKRPMLTECFWVLRRRYLVINVFNFTSDNCVRYEATFVGHYSIFCPTLSDVRC